MKLVAVLALAAFAHARPEAGYSYSAPSAQAPSSSYGAPSGSSGLTGIITGGGIGSTGFGGISGGGSSYSSGGSSSYAGGSYAGGSYNQAPIVSKHVYVHVAPEEPEQQRPARIIAPSQPRKHYKIVFIKAPTPATPQGAQIQLPQQDEEKTIIYVLSKKQEDQADIQVQAAAPTTPTKPEVYFIKYNTKKDQTSGLSLSAGAAPSSGYGVPASISANAGPSSNYIPPAPAAPSSSYGVPSANGGPY